MDVGVYKLSELNNEIITAKITARESFTIECEDFTRYSATLAWLEKTIESQDLKVRLYMVGRSAAMGTALLSVVGVAAAVGTGLAIAAHNVATWSPDYEIGKSPITKTIYVEFKK